MTDDPTTPPEAQRHQIYSLLAGLTARISTQRQPIPKIFVGCHALVRTTRAVGLHPPAPMAISPDHDDRFRLQLTWELRDGRTCRLSSIANLAQADQLRDQLQDYANAPRR